MSTASKPDWRSLPRKPADEKRDQRVDVRVSAIEFARLREKAAQAGVSLSDYLRNRGLGKKISSP